VLAGRWADAARSFTGHRLLLATAVPGYMLLGARSSDDQLVREIVRALKAIMTEVPPALPTLASGGLASP
jgi:hypothetical protein